MAFATCPECGRSISDKALFCPGCGYPLKKEELVLGARPTAWTFGYEYKSPKKIFGMPLVHIVYGPAWGGGLKPAKGFIAIGNIAVGVFAIGGFALGIFSLAGIGLGLVSIAGIALGVALGVGGIAVGYLAVGGIAIGVYALGALSMGSHTIFNNPQMRDWLRKLVGY